VRRPLRLIGACVVALAFASPAYAHTDGGWQLSLRWPASGTVTRPFGNDAWGFHPGIDIGELRSLDVSAAAPGVVEAVGETKGFEGYGTIVLVDLGHGFEALYAHLEQPLVAIGDEVTTGQQLGIAGCTGLCTGTHLHFELREDGTAVDPTPILPATLPAPEGG
jgi:murein DD-endopeptidase MepM/ murein hydrolase activator NlpD